MRRLSNALFLTTLIGAVSILTSYLWSSWTRPSLSSTCSPGSPSPTNPDGAGVLNNGTTVVAGKPVFPFGFYHVSWSSTTIQLNQDLQAIANAGFNTIHASAVDSKLYGSVLARAKRLGIHVITEPGSTELATQYGRNQAVLGWNIADDVDNGKHPPATVAAQNTAVKAVDPLHLTYISGYTQDLPTYYAKTADILAMQSYPINFGREAEISATFPLLAKLTQGLQGCNRAAYANLQAFSWKSAQPHIPGLRAPTPAEARNMTYQAIVAGVKGIIYYTYSDGTWVLPQDDPKLWQSLKSLVPEVNTLTPYLLNAKLTPLLTGQSKVFSGWWALPKQATPQQATLIVVNASYRNSPSVLLSLPAKPKSQTFLFRDRPLSQSQPTANQLQVTLSPLSVLVYKIQF